MPIDPCLEGCLNHMIGAGEGPSAGDDPCNSANNGYFCEGSYWTYDPTAPGADTGTYGDCPRAWIRTGPDCNVDQWLEISIASVITDTVAPVDGVDCCPPGTMWCVPAAGDVALNQIWIQTGCVGDNCRWCKICGFGSHHISVVGAPAPGTPVIDDAPEGVVTAIPFDTIDLNHLGLATLPTITVQTGGCYEVNGWALFEYNSLDPVFGNFEAALLRLIVTVNGVPQRNIGDVAYMTLNRPPGNPITMAVQGSDVLCPAAGDVIGLSFFFNTNFGGQSIDLIASLMTVTPQSFF